MHRGLAPRRGIEKTRTSTRGLTRGFGNSELFRKIPRALHCRIVELLPNSDSTRRRTTDIPKDSKRKLLEAVKCAAIWRRS